MERVDQRPRPPGRPGSGVTYRASTACGPPARKPIRAATRGWRPAKWLAGLFLFVWSLSSTAADWVNDPDLDGIVDLLDPDYQQQAITVARLPLKYAITQVHGRGERVLYTFEDPNCGYCRQLHRTLGEIGNLTVHTFVLTFLGPDSGARFDAVWCSDNRAGGWDRTMRQGATLPAPTDGCRAPAPQTMKLAAMLGVNLTPTIFFADGSRMNGVRPRAEIEKRLAKAR
jgi:hypothetical protein